MSIAKSVVKRPTTFLIIYALIAGLALYIVPQVPLDLFPEINPPILVIFTSYEGAGPEEVEQTVTRPMEGALTNVSNVKEITSTSSEGSSMIMLEFGWGEDLAEATNEVRDKLEFVKDFLPDDAGSPQIFKFDPSMIPIIQLSVQGNRSPDEIFGLVEDQIQPRLEQINGVAMVSVSGGREQAVRVEISQNRLAAYGLTITQVVQSLYAQNIQIGSGSVFEGNYKYLVETSGQFDGIDQIRDTVVAYKGGGINPATGASLGSPVEVRLRDIATIVDGYKDTSTSMYVNGEPGIYISIQKQSGTNSIEVADNVIAELDVLRTILPSGVDMSIIYDTTKIIRTSLQGVTSSAILGGILAMVILFVFLRNLKSTIIIGISIPLSILVTVMVMYFSGLTLNIMTLAGLALGIGMIVDTSIVILENIFRYREKGAKSVSASHLGAQEMITAVAASTLTTVAIFLPVLMFKAELDIIGVLFQDLGLTIVISLLASLVVAVTLVPVLTSKYLRLFTRKQRPIKFKPIAAVDNWMDKGFRGLDNAYKRLLGKVLNHKFLSLMIIGLVVVISLVMAVGLDFELMPEQAQDMVQISVELPVGTRYEVTEDVLLELADIARNEINGYENLFILAGNDGGFFGGESANKGVLYITLPPFEQQIDSYQVMLEKIRAHYDEFPSVNFNASSQNFLSGGSPIDIVLRTEDLEKARNVAMEIRDLLEDVPEVSEPQISLNEGLPMASVIIDRDKAYALGLNIYSVANEISAAIDGQTAGRYRAGSSEYDILVILQEEDRRDIPDLEKLFIFSQLGELIPVSSIARVERTAGPVSISREDRSRVVHITANMAAGVNVNVAQPAVRRAIEENIILDDDIILEYAGDFDALMEYLGKFAIVMLVALALVYGIMASLFESLLDPFIIFLSIMLVIPGIIFLYALMGTPLSMFSAVGLLMLVGISVNNGIVLVDYTNLLRSRDMPIRQAVIEAGGNRLRPVLMTSLTTILGMVPLAFAAGEGSELVQPIGQTIVGGMVMSTLMTLFFVPTVYVNFSLFSEFSKRFMHKHRTKFFMAVIALALVLFAAAVNAPVIGDNLMIAGAAAFAVAGLLGVIVFNLMFMVDYWIHKKRGGWTSYCDEAELAEAKALATPIGGGEMIKETEEPTEGGDQ